MPTIVDIFHEACYLFENGFLFGEISFANSVIPAIFGFCPEPIRTLFITFCIGRNQLPFRFLLRPYAIKLNARLNKVPHIQPLPFLLRPFMLKSAVIQLFKFEHSLLKIVESSIYSFPKYLLLEWE